MSIYSQLKAPYITEKTNLIKEAENKFCFKVDKHTNKVEVKKAIEKIFSVKVEKSCKTNKALSSPIIFINLDTSLVLGILSSKLSKTCIFFSLIYLVNTEESAMHLFFTNIFSQYRRNFFTFLFTFKS